MLSRVRQLNVIQDHKRIFGLKNILGQKKMLGPNIILGLKKTWIWKIWVSKKKLGLKNFLVLRKFWSKKYGIKKFGQQYFWTNKIVGQNKIWAQKKLCSKNFLVWKLFGLKKFGAWKKIWGIKTNLGLLILVNTTYVPQLNFSYALYCRFCRGSCFCSCSSCDMAPLGH